MKFAMTKLAAATTIALAFSNVNAAVINGDTVLVNILKDGSTGESMIIDTNVLATDFRTGTLSSWTSNVDLTAAINAFIGASTDVDYYVVGYEDLGLNKYGLANKIQLNETSVESMNGQFNIDYLGAANSVFGAATEGLTENWLTGIPDGDPAHYENNFLFGNGYVQGFALGETAAFYSSHSNVLGAPNNTQLLDWNLSADGSLTYGVSAVPVPAAVWLFGSGLLGLVGVARRRKA
jgi:hypothetical protein